jgi:nucleotide-binding universal stress UspA family protein
VESEEQPEEAAMRAYVVAGVDGSPPSVVAAATAADWAVLAGHDLHLVHGYPVTPWPGPGPFPPPAMVPPSEGDEVLQRAAEAIAPMHPDLVIDRRQVAGHPAAVLVAESRWAALTVVGNRGTGGLAALLVGSTATAVAAHARGPVLVVRAPGLLPGPGSPVIVGVDGSSRGEQALGFAFDAAARTGAALVAVHAWWASGLETALRRGRYVPEEALAAAGALLTGAVASWREKYPGVRVVEKLAHSLNPAEELVARTADAGLLVVGPRGHGGFAGLLLGSVTSAVVQHAACPVVVARAHPHSAS